MSLRGVVVVHPGGDDAANCGSLADRAYEELRQRILDSGFEPGTALSVPALARELEISRSPVREAVQRLIHEGLATHVPNRGAEVARLEISELIEIYEVKEPLLGLAARLAATRLTEVDVDALKAMMDEQDAALAGDTPESRFMELDVAFHGFIADVAANETLRRTVASFDNKTSRAFPSGWSNREYARLSVEEHHAITDALIAGDADAAERASCAHVRKVRIRLARRHGEPHT